MIDPRSDYHAYLLRLWHTEQAGRSVWRMALEDAHTGERRGFATLDQLVAFLQALTGSADLSDSTSPGKDLP